MRQPLIALLLLLSPTARAGGELLPIGARFAGMGGTGLTLVDPWALRLNPAGIAGIEVPTAGLFYQQHYFSGDLANQALTVVLPVGNGSFGVAADRFGYDLYNETRGSVAYAMRFGDGLRAAVQLNYLGVRIGENYGSTSAFTAEVGVQARLTETVWLGAHLYNPTRAELGTLSESDVTLDERVPTLLRAGFGYMPSTKLTLTAEIEKDIDREERVRCGVEYNPSKVLFLRTGISTGPVSGYFGAGFRMQRLDVDLAMAVRSELGPTPMINLNYRFK